MADPKTTPAGSEPIRGLDHANAVRADLAKLADTAALYSPARREEFRAQAKALREPAAPTFDGYQAAVKQAHDAQANLWHFSANMKGSYEGAMRADVEASGRRVSALDQEFERNKGQRTAAHEGPEWRAGGPNTRATPQEARQHVADVVKNMQPELAAARMATHAAATRLAGHFPEGSKQREELNSAAAAMRGAAPKTAGEARNQAEATVGAMRTVFEQQNALHRAGKLSAADTAELAKANAPLAQSMGKLTAATAELKNLDVQLAQTRVQGAPEKQHAKPSSRSTDVAGMRKGAEEAKAAALQGAEPLRAALKETQSMRSEVASNVQALQEARASVAGMRETEAGAIRQLAAAGEAYGLAREAYAKASETLTNARHAAMYGEGGASAAPHEYRAEKELKAALGAMEKAQAGLTQAESGYNAVRAALSAQESKVAELDKGLEAAKSRLASREESFAMLQDKAAETAKGLLQREAALAKAEKREPQDLAKIAPALAEVLNGRQEASARSAEARAGTGLSGETVASMVADATRKAEPATKPVAEAVMAAISKSEAHTAAQAGALAGKLEGKLDEVRKTLLSGDPNRVLDEASKTTPLMAAQRLGLQDVAQTLLERGADPNARNADGKTAAELVTKARESTRDVEAGPREKSAAEKAMEHGLQAYVRDMSKPATTVEEFQGRTPRDLAAEYTRAVAGMDARYDNLAKSLDKPNEPAASPKAPTHER